MPIFSSSPGLNALLALVFWLSFFAPFVLSAAVLFLTHKRRQR